jgi:hypothetical protein
MEAKPKTLNLEETCRTVLGTHLERSQTFHRLEWEDHPNGNNSPPDYNLITEDKTYAIEVTGLTRIKKSKDDKIDARTYEISRIKMADELTNKALELGILQGTYTIHFVFDWLVQLKKARSQIRKQVFDYVRKSREKDVDLDTYIRYQFKTVGQISKISNKKSRIYATFSDADWSDSPEVLASAFNMVQRAVSSKLSKLKKGNVRKPWILLLYNTNPFVSETTFKKCEGQREVEGKEAFDRIFILTSLESGFDFYIKGLG